MKLTNTRRQPSSVSFNAVFLGKRTYFSLSWKWPTYRSSHMHGRRLRDPFARRANLQRFKCSNHRSHTRFFLLMLLPCYTQALRGGPTQHQQVPDTHTHTHARTNTSRTDVLPVAFVTRWVILHASSSGKRSSSPGRWHSSGTHQQGLQPDRGRNSFSC